MAGFDYLAEVRRLGGLEFTPQTPEAWVELARTLKNRSRSAEHARRIIDRFLEPGAEARCPTPGDLAVVAKGVAADPKLDRPELAAACEECEPYAGNWRWCHQRAGLERCSCARGLKLRAMDDARGQPKAERPTSRLEQASDTDWARRAAGDL